MGTKREVSAGDPCQVLHDKPVVIKIRVYSIFTGSYFVIYVFVHLFKLFLDESQDFLGDVEELTDKLF